ncbi:WD repeat-containing protein 74 [Prorops nasuta]|uniref:WD repeat-containing protein 74 n=1 Tax=Prorops nasuta TaxID=863751 RepID=UPI0034CD215B
MSYKEDFNVFVGAQSGLLKGVKLTLDSHVTKNIQNLVSIKEEDQIASISWADEKEKEIFLACGSKNSQRCVKVYNTQDSIFTSSFTCDFGEGPIVGIAPYNKGILTAVKSGEIKLWRFKDNDEVILNVGNNLCKMCNSFTHENIIATGGKENELKLYNVETKTKIFTEKNIRHDWLEMRVPVWISDIAFLPGIYKVATVGRYGHVRLYDTNAQRRPVINIEMKDEAITTLTIAPKDNHIIIGSNKGKMNLVDLRKSGKVLNTYKGFTGSVTGIACSQTQPYILSTSLDRFLRVHHLETKALIKKVYLTSRLTGIAVRSEFTLQKSEQTENISECKIIDNNMDSEEEYDEMFNEMQKKF